MKLLFEHYLFTLATARCCLKKATDLLEKSLNAAAKEEEVVAQKITIDFIKSKLQADASDKSGEDDLTRASSTGLCHSTF